MLYLVQQKKLLSHILGKRNKMKQPKTVSEHIIALYGQIKGLKTAICSIRTNDLKHMHGDIDRLHNKIDRLLWWIIGGLGATLLTIITVLI